MLQGVTWFQHSSCSIRRDNFVIYIDPWDLPRNCPPADLILITHDHFDHYVPSEIARLWKTDTQLVVPQSMFGQVPAIAHYLKPGATTTLAGVQIKATAAYNTNRIFHPAFMQSVGYLIHLGNTSYYHAGDTDLVPEMAAVRADVAFLPIGGTYTMDPQAAAKAAAIVQAKAVVPIHWGRLTGTTKEAALFAELVGTPAKVLEQGREQ